MTLGEVIKEYRSAHNYSMEDMAGICGISKAYVSILEKNYNPATKGPVIPSLQVIKKVASGIGVSFDELLQKLNDDTVVSFDFAVEEVNPSTDAADAASRSGKITNTQGVELPSTGGIGTTIFYIIGAILVLGAGILLVTRRRMNAN